MRIKGIEGGKVKVVFTFSERNQEESMSFYCCVVYLQLDYVFVVILFVTSFESLKISCNNNDTRLRTSLTFFFLKCLPLR